MITEHVSTRVKPAPRLDAMEHSPRTANGQGSKRPWDCAAQGLECVLVGPVGSEYMAKCGVPGATCDGQPELRCEGENFLWCPGDAPTSPSVQNCSVQGKICNGVFCGEDGNCEDGVSCSADKSVMTYCIDGKPSSYLCKEIGPDFVCDETTGQCVTNAPSAACGPDGDTSHCDGDFAMICLHGFEVRVDCSLAGGTCVHDVNTRCVPR